MRQTQPVTARPRIATVSTNGQKLYGVIRDDGFVDLSDKFPEWPDLRAVIEGGGLGVLVATASGLPVSHTEFFYEIPIGHPEKIICVGVNFPDRNDEYKDGQEAPGRPSMFVRFPRSFVGHGQNIVRPPESRQLDYEGEVTIIIGKAGRRIPEKDAYSHIAAVTLCNEGTIRDWVRHAKFNVTQGKNWDRSGSIGPWLVPLEDPSQLDDIRLETRVNGEVRQSDRTGRMLYDFRYIVSYVSTFTTLVPGDVIVCGTPTGAGARFDPPLWLKPGDVIEIEAEGIGILRNGVEDETC